MKKFIIEEEFWNVFPKSKIGIIVCNNIKNDEYDKEYFSKLLMESQLIAKKYLVEDKFSNNKVIKVWRDAFMLFKTKKGVRSSIESLLKRVNSDKEIGIINPLVDIYNSISLSYAMPCGGEDLDSIVGNIKLTKALGNEEFITLGSDNNSPPYENEIIYKDDAGAICRCFNWRESERTMLTRDTKNAFICIELVDETREEEFINALDELKKNIDMNLGGKSKQFILDIKNKEIEF